MKIKEYDVVIDFHPYKIAIHDMSKDGKPWFYAELLNGTNVIEYVSGESIKEVEKHLRKKIETK